QGNHTLESIAEDQKNIESAIANYEKTNSTYKNRSVKYYSQKTNREIAIDFGMNPPSNMLDYDIRSEYLLKNSTTSRLAEDIQKYVDLTTIYNEFRTGKRFKCTEI